MAIFDVLKTAAKVAQEAGKIELYGQILEVYEKLLDQQKKIDELEKKNKKLEDKLAIKGKLIADGNLYWLEDESGKDGPFCTCCWDSEQTLMRLHKATVSGRMHCPKCKTEGKSGKAIVFNASEPRRNSAL